MGFANIISSPCFFSFRHGNISTSFDLACTSVYKLFHKVSSSEPSEVNSLWYWNKSICFFLHQHGWLRWPESPHLLEVSVTTHSLELHTGSWACGLLATTAAALGTWSGVKITEMETLLSLILNISSICCSGDWIWAFSFCVMLNCSWKKELGWEKKEFQQACLGRKLLQFTYSSWGFIIPAVGAKKARVCKLNMK